MNLNRIISIFIIFSLFVIGCKKESEEDPNIAKLENDLEISDFIWKGLNQYYYWQESVMSLADSKLDNLSDYSILVKILILKTFLIPFNILMIDLAGFRMIMKS